MKKLQSLLFLILFPSIIFSQEILQERIRQITYNQTEKSKEIYIDLHQNPELSFMEFKTSEKMANKLKSLGFEVTTNVGGNGVIGVFKNGKGKTILLRTDMDALPIKENTGLPFASQVFAKDFDGVDAAVMHACGHDLHMTTWLGTLQALLSLKDEWKGTIVAIAQPAEEMSGGSNAMIADGLFTRFPKPDYALAYHVSAELPTGTIGYYPGAIFAGVNSIDISVFGQGGHGAMPHTTIDPIVLASRIVLDIQTIVSREINPIHPAVVTVGSIHGGTKHNIIPDEVDMQLTVRFFSDETYNQIIEALKRITRGIAISAGLNKDKWPLVKISNQFTPPVVNNSSLVLKAIEPMKQLLGDKNVIQVEPLTVGEDFGKYGRTKENIPIALFWLGGVNKVKYQDHLEKGTILPGLHNAAFYPDFEPTYKTGVSTMTYTMIQLFNQK
ncbi:MAG: amidohydrolase [Bacteroidetes bacterium]|nr:MAG: amidohydrolase [Bacteroidota bacterium]